MLSRRHYVGKERASDVKIKIQHDTKEALTTLASVTARGDLLPLYILAKGKTKRCEINQIKGVKEFDYQTPHSPSGWTTSTVMERYLTWLRTRIMNIMEQKEKQSTYYLMCTELIHANP